MEGVSTGKAVIRSPSVDEGLTLLSVVSAAIGRSELAPAEMRHG